MRVFDASPDGCKIEFVERPDLGEALWVKFEGMELLEARVRWTEGFTAGVEFKNRSIRPSSKCSSKSWSGRRSDFDPLRT